jgi:hypothetical protein
MVQSDAKSGSTRAKFFLRSACEKWKLDAKSDEMIEAIVEIAVLDASERLRLHSLQRRLKKPRPQRQEVKPNVNAQAC